MCFSCSDAIKNSLRLSPRDFYRGFVVNEMVHFNLHFEGLSTLKLDIFDLLNIPKFPYFSSIFRNFDYALFH